MRRAQFPPDEGDDRAKYVEDSVVLSERQQSGVCVTISLLGEATSEDRFSVGSRVSLLSGRSTEDDCCTR